MTATAKKKTDADSASLILSGKVLFLLFVRYVLVA